MALLAKQIFEGLSEYLCEALSRGPLVSLSMDMAKSGYFKSDQNGNEISGSKMKFWNRLILEVYLTLIGQF